MVLRLLALKKRKLEWYIGAAILQNIENGPDFLENTITCDESWLFSVVPRKCKSVHWKSSSSPRGKKSMAEQI